MVYYAHDEKGNPADEIVSAKEIVAQCRDSDRPRNGQRVVSDMEAGYAQRIFEHLGTLTTDELTIQRYNFMRAKGGADIKWFEAGQQQPEQRRQQQRRSLA